MKFIGIDFNPGRDAQERPRRPLHHLAEARQQRDAWRGPVARRRQRRGSLMPSLRTLTVITLGEGAQSSGMRTFRLVCLPRCPDPFT